MPSVWGTEPDIGAEYIDANKQRANIMTKALPIGQGDSALELLRIIDL